MKIALSLCLIVAGLFAGTNQCAILDWKFVQHADKAYPEYDYDEFICSEAIKSLQVLAEKSKISCPISKEEDEYAKYTFKNIKKVCGIGY